MIPRVRAILSWNILPPAGNPDWLPIWGDVMECFVQIKPRYKLFKDFLGEIIEISPNIQIPPEYQLIDVGPLPDPPPLTLAQLSKKYQNAEPHRFGLTDIHAMLTTADIDQDNVAAKIEEWNSIGIDLAKSVDILISTNANVDYEQLECLGLNYNEEKLVANIRIKSPTGYSGSLCTPGSIEYVAFWADWDNTCKWTFLGFGKISVHDFEQVFPKEGICYSITWPVDLSQYRQSCEKPKIARVRAVLSWNVPSSITNPDDLRYWGNRLDSYVQIKPTEEAPAGLIFNQVHEIDIDDTSGLTLPSPHEVKYVDNGNDVDGKMRACPFGGKITIRSYDIFSDWVGKYYKIEVTSPTVGNIPLSGDLSVVKQDGTWDLVPRFGNYYKILTLEKNEERILYRWISNVALDDLCTFKIEVRDAANDSGNLLFTTGHKIQLDNTKPLTPLETPATMNWNTIADRLDIHIGSAGIGILDCKKFKVGSEIEGNFVAQDKNFGYFSISLHPGINPGFLVTPSSGSDNTPDPGAGWPTAGGSTWKLQTATATSKMKPCGYVVYLYVQDTSIVGTVGTDAITHNHNSTSVGFCLEE